MKAYKVIKSNIHRKGLCAARNIKENERIIEYRGKKRIKIYPPHCHVIDLV